MKPGTRPRACCGHSAESVSPDATEEQISAVILLIDNYDSFVHNLARHFRRLGQETCVMRNDAVDVASIRRMRPHAIVLSPGPCTPNEAGCSVEVVRQFYTDVPILGVCLGHQAIAAAFGAAVVRAPEPVHGRTSPIHHDGRGIFAGLPDELHVCRYHSLVVDETTLPADLEASAWTTDGVVMALRHKRHLTIGVQFHPEAILTERGYDLLAAFLRLSGLKVPAPLPSQERDLPPVAAPQASAGPVTF
jgi:anthranilate synthase/aminodeoxychorismate synthase-like glutamine amidotransferase